MPFAEQLRGLILIRSKVFCMTLEKDLILCQRSQWQLGPKWFQCALPERGSGKRAESEVQDSGSCREIKLVCKLPPLSNAG